ncbi:Uncharacterized protein BP5553_04831 [Venustampulla echinocandica]|uniref:Enoyl reductase (ER) domain-containing protein n=1 Tax=Venustampulla echinocandica TaxID=2656787 RepID=A0A370TPG3_9HELO|nr:Uncharacterized protein BP5553_04831 [Venustampulla echinocandica]RDL37398.1 Uncharacterized protein BP5553_04831 [Venustampulla echinocandica]
MSAANQHLAAVLPSKGSSLSVTYRPTPKPGPTDILIEVKSIALNPIDVGMRDIGFAIASYPAIPGSDVAGTVISIGSSVAADAPQPGTRVAGFAPAFAMKGDPDYGGFQTRVLVPEANVTPLPEGVSFNEAAMLPMAVYTTWAGWYQLGIDRATAYDPSEKKGILVWGGSSSIGSSAVQLAKLMGFVVYATASEKHHEYVKSLGATRVFDYKSKDVSESIVKAAKADGVEIQLGYDAIGEVQPCLNVLEAAKGSGVAKLATSKPIQPDTPTMDGVEVSFISIPADTKVRTEFFHQAFNVWLKEKLETKEFVPSPRARVVSGGLEGLNEALDELKKGVSATKLVLEL